MNACRASLENLCHLTPQAPAAPQLPPATPAQLILISSAIAHINIPNTCAYSVAKIAVGQLTEFFASENLDVFALSVRPGIIGTEPDGKRSGAAEMRLISMIRGVSLVIIMLHYHCGVC